MNVELDGETLMNFFSAATGFAAIAAIQNFEISPVTKIVVLSTLALGFTYAGTLRDGLERILLLGLAAGTDLLAVFTLTSAYEIGSQATAVLLAAISVAAATYARKMKDIREYLVDRELVRMGYGLAAALIAGSLALTAADMSAGLPSTQVDLDETFNASESENQVPVGALTATNSFPLPKEAEEPEIDSRLCGREEVSVTVHAEEFGYRERIPGSSKEQFRLTADFSMRTREPAEFNGTGEIRRGTECRGDELLVSVGDEIGGEPEVAD
ncbi:MAG: hypothetical protein ABEJ03_04910 [Candidatus Nanohaloarchaea archaeon]